MPLETSPRSLPRLMCTPPGRCESCSATGTKSPAAMLSAPVTIWMGSPCPTSTWQMCRWSELACGATDRTLPTTTFSTSAARFSTSSTALPFMIMRRANSSGAMSIFTYCFSQESGASIP